MAIKLIATDLDGTLMSPDHVTITPRTKQALLNAHNKGVKIAIATGRTLCVIEDVIKQIPFIDYVIYSNGASVYDIKTNKNIYINHIPTEITKKILVKLNSLPVHYNTYVEGGIFGQKGTQKHYEKFDLPNKFIEQYTKLTNICDDIITQLEGKSAEIISAYSADQNQLDTIKSFLEENNLFVTSSLPDEIEVTVSDANKGNALKGICEITGILPQEVMCFGDAMNDAPMIAFAGYSFSMDNAVDELKEIAKYVADSNAEDGLAKAVEEYVLSN